MYPRRPEIPPTPEKNRRAAAGLMGVSLTLFALFVAEIVICLGALSATVHAGLAGRPVRDLVLLSAVTFVSAVASYPVVVGLGMGVKFRRFLSWILVAFALAMIAAAAFGAARKGAEAGLMEEEIDREMKNISFEIDYPDEKLGKRHAEILELRRDSLVEQKKTIAEGKRQALLDAAPVAAGAFLILVLNVIFAAECARMLGRSDSAEA